MTLFNNERSIILENNICKFGKKLWNPKINSYNNKTKKSNSWFDIKIHETKNNKVFKNFFKNKEKKCSIKPIISCDKIKLFLTPIQQIIILNWMNFYIQMYNQTLRFINESNFKHTQFSYNFRKLRTKFMKNAKQNLINKSDLGIEGLNTKIKSHMLDAAIKSVCTAFKSCFTNLKHGNIKHFRVRYIKLSKKRKILDIEKSFVSKKNNTLCESNLGSIILTEKNFDLKTIKTDFKIHYNAITNEFILLIPKKNNIIKTTKKEFVSIDPGIRTFLTCFNNNKITEIGTNLTATIKPLLQKIDKYNNNKNIPIRVKKKMKGDVIKKSKTKLMIYIGNLLNT